MNNPVLKAIAIDAAAKLQAAYGFVGVAIGPDMAQLNSSDGAGNDIVVKIEVKPE